MKDRIISTILSVVGLFLLAAVPAVAQTPTQHFVISASAANYNGKGTQMVQLSGIAVQVTKDVSAGYLQIANPADGTQPKYHLGVLNYTRELHAFLGKKLSSKVVFDTTNWLITVQAGGGKVTYAGVNRVAEVGGVFVSRPLADHLQWQVIGYQYLHGQGNSILTRNNSQQLASGLTFTF